MCLNEVQIASRLSYGILFAVVPWGLGPQLDCLISGQWDSPGSFAVKRPFASQTSHGNLLEQGLSRITDARCSHLKHSGLRNRLNVNLCGANFFLLIDLSDD